MTAATFLTSATPSLWPTPKVNVQFLTPNFAVDMPPKSVVPYMEYSRMIYAGGGQILSGAVSQVQSQSFNMPQIPDLIVVYVKPVNYLINGVGAVDPGQGDWYLPLASRADGVANPVSLSFDNFNGLLSSHTTEQLYEMSVRNGLDVDYNTFIGEAHVGAAQQVGTLAGSNAGGAAAGRVALVGSPLVLRPGIDIVLQAGQASSLVGNFTFQIQMQVKNTSPYTITSYQMYIMTINSGFFETIRGSSRQIRGVLSEQDIIQAEVAPMGTISSMSRIVGGGIFGSLGNILSKAKDIYNATKPAVSAIKGLLPESGMAGHAKNALGAVGYGTGGGPSGGKRRGLDARLM